MLVFALIYQGAPNWAAADGVVTLFPRQRPADRGPAGRDAATAPGCARIALLESRNGEISVRREVNYIDGGQSALDQAYGWGMNWSRGRK